MKRILVFVFTFVTLLSWKVGVVRAACNTLTCNSTQCALPACNSCGFCFSGTTGGSGPSTTTGGASSLFGQITLPSNITTLYGSDPGVAVGSLLQMIFRLLIVVAGVYALLNFILAGYGFLSAEGDPKKIEGAWAKIWQSALGLAVVAGSFTLAAIFGKLIFGDASFILTPVIPTL